MSTVLLLQWRDRLDKTGEIWADAREAETRLINEIGKRPRLAEAIRKSAGKEQP